MVACVISFLIRRVSVSATVRRRIIDHQHVFVMTIVPHCTYVTRDSRHKKHKRVLKPGNITHNIPHPQAYKRIDVLICHQLIYYDAQYVPINYLGILIRR